MYALLQPELYLYFLLFLIATFFSWFIPGWVALSVVKFKSLSLKFLVALPTGLALWGIQGYLLGYANLRILTITYILFFAFLFFSEQKKRKFIDFKQIWSEIKKQKWYWIIVILLSSVIQIYSHMGSGLLSNQGLAFYFVNSVDGVMHLAYIQELVTNFPPQEPGAVDLPLVNYHYWSDLIQADLVRIWKLPLIHVFFQYAPLLISTWTTMLFLRLVSYLGGSTNAKIVALLLITFGGDGAYLITQYLHGHWGPDVSSLDSGVTFYFNIPQVYARFVFIGAIVLFTKWKANKSFKTGMLLAALIGSLFGFKVYYALYAVFGFCFTIGIEILINLVKNLKHSLNLQAITASLNKSKNQILLVVLLAFISLAIYLPVNKGAGGLTYSFFEWPRLLLSADNIDYIDWFLKMQVYKAYDNTRNIFIYNVWAVILTFVAVYGTRMIGMWPLLKSKNEHVKNLMWFFIPANILFIILGLFTLQTSGGLNIFNFLIVPIFSFNVFAALAFTSLNKKIFIPILVIFTLLTIPRSILQLELFYDRYTTTNADAVITPNELAAYAYLRSQKNAVVQKTTDEHYNYQTPYVSFMSGNPTYISGISMLESHNQPTEERLLAVETALEQADTNLKVTMLADLGITHFIVPTSEFLKPNFWPADVAFQNDSVTVLRISSP